MRLKLILAAVRRETSLPIDYQHFLSGLIYDRLRSEDSEFARMLHDMGFDANGRRFKLFTFSRLHTKHAMLEKGRLFLKHSDIELQISSPIAKFIQHLTASFSNQQPIRIEQAQFVLKSLAVVPPPRFDERMFFRALSPLTMAYKKVSEPDRFLTLDDEWSELMLANLLGKYQALHHREPADHRLEFKWDASYIAEASRRGKKLSVLKRIHEVDVRGWLAPFRVEGSSELIELGYEAGFGSRNSMGFGMAEVA